MTGGDRIAGTKVCGLFTTSNLSPAHVIRYKPIPGEDPDYLICFQCGFVLRKFDVPPDERFDFGSNSVGTGIVARLIKNAMGRKNQLDAERVTAAAQQILDGLLVHLLSTPVGLRIGRWLREDYPDLIPLQDRQVMRELTTNEGTQREADGSETALPRYQKHLLSDKNGAFPEDINEWEKDVLETELSRSDLVAWYRNPSRASQDSLGILYQDGGQNKSVRPDFVFFAKRADGSIVSDIVDPHGTQFADAIPKLKGLAKYRRIDAIAKVGDKYRVLDLKEESVRSAVESATSVTRLYGSGVAADYAVTH
jgi:hypothetical protein